MNGAFERAMLAAVQKAQESMNSGYGGPFGAAVLKDGKVISVTANSVLRDHDPSAHAEVNAIREAGRVLGTHDLRGCVLLATGYPCPMCLSAIIWANIDTVYFGCEAWEAERIGFRDDAIYRFIETKRTDGTVLRLHQMGHEACVSLYDEYMRMGKTLY